MAQRNPPYIGSVAGRGKVTSTTVTKTAKAPSGSKNFNAAFRAARNAGKKEFSFGGKRFTTELAKPATKTVAVKTVAQGPAKQYSTDRQSRQVRETKTPVGLASARTAFDRPAASAGRVAEAKAYLDRSPEARAKKNAAMQRNVNTALTVAGALPVLGAAARGIQGLRAAGAIGSGIRGAMGATARLGRNAAPAVATKTATKTVTPRAAKVVATKTVTPKVTPTTSTTPRATKTVAKKVVTEPLPAAAASPRGVAQKPVVSARVVAATRPNLSAKSRLLSGSAPVRPVGAANFSIPPRGMNVTVTRTRAGGNTDAPTSRENVAALRRMIGDRKTDSETRALAKKELAASSSDRPRNIDVSTDAKIALLKDRGLVASKQLGREIVRSKMPSQAAKVSPRAAALSSASTPTMGVARLTHGVPASAPKSNMAAEVTKMNQMPIASRRAVVDKFVRREAVDAARTKRLADQKTKAITAKRNATRAANKGA